MGVGLWRPAWFVAFLSAGSVLLVIGAIWAMMGKPDGFVLMLIAVVFFGLAVILLSVYSWLNPKPPGGLRR